MAAISVESEIYRWAGKAKRGIEIRLAQVQAAVRIGPPDWSGAAI
jgi:hypothetical protein